MAPSAPETTAARYFDEAAFQRECLHEAAEAATTFYDVVFAGGSNAVDAAPPNTPPALLLAADSSGTVRAYLSAAVAATWLTAREPEPSSDPVFAWRAHQGGGACYRLAAVGGLLVTAGDDGFVRGWRLAEIGEGASVAAQRREEAREAEEEQHERQKQQLVRRPASAAAAGRDQQQRQQQQQQLAPAFEVLLPSSSSSSQGQHRHLTTSQAPPPAAQALAVDAHGGREPAAFCGASDGGLYCVSGLADGRAALASVSSSFGGGGVLAADVCPATGALAAGGEDGVVRLWADPRQGVTAGQPVATFVAGREEAAGARPSAAAGAAAGTATAPSSSPPYVSALKFDPGAGGWLVAGTGAGQIELYSLRMNALARRANAAGGGSGGSGGSAQAPPPVPQALLLRPGEILAAGTAPALVSHRFSLDPPSEIARCEVGTDSAFALASAAPGGGGVLAVAGAGATIELLSAQFTRLGLVQPPPSSLSSPPV